MKIFIKILAGIIVVPVTLLIALLVFIVLTHEITIYEHEIDEERELVIYGILDDGPGPFAEVALIKLGDEIDRIPVSFALTERDKLSDEIEIIKQNDEVFVFTYTDEFTVYTFEANLLTNKLKSTGEKHNKRDSNQSAHTTPASAPR